MQSSPSRLHRCNHFSGIAFKAILAIMQQPLEISPPSFIQVSSAHLIARARPLEALQVVLVQAASGRGSCVLISGEAGVGKSRLVQELLASHDVSGYRILQGGAIESSVAYPYAPLMDLLRSALASLSTAQTATLLGPLTGVLSGLLPELAWTLPTEAPAASLAPELERQQLFEALMQLLARLANASPLLIIIEDIHWSDEATLEFLHLLARRLSTRPICLLLTMRPQDGSPALDSFLSRLNRERLAGELPLDALSLEGVDAMLRSMFHWRNAVKPPLLNVIFDLTEGNPFFVEEVANALVATGDIYRVTGGWRHRPVAQLKIPHSLRLVVEGRMAQVSAEAAEMLALAAVVGRKLDFDLLTQLTGRDEASLLRLIRELVRARLLVELTPDTLAFRHALTREVIYTGLLSRRRRNLHCVIAAWLEGRTEPTAEELTQLAYHSFEGGLWSEALRTGQAAGAQALHRFAPYSALAHLERSATAAGHLDLPLSALLRQLRGRARQMVGDFAAARSDFEALLAEALDSGDRMVEWQALHDLGYLMMTSDYAQAGAFLDQALATARGLGTPDILARSLNRLGNWLANAGRPLEALALHQEALAIVESMGAKAALATTLDLIATAHGITGNNAASKDHYQRALPLFEALDDRQGMASTLTMLTTSNNADAGHHALAISKEIGWRDGEAYAHIRLAMALAWQGRFGPALEHSERGLAIAVEIEHLPWQTAALQSLGFVYTQMELPKEAIGYLLRARQLAQASGAAVWADSVTSLLALAETSSGQYRRAAMLLKEVNAPLDGLESIGRRLLALAAGELALAQGKPARALAVAETILRALPALPDWHDDTLPLILLLQGRALAEIDRQGEAANVLAEALDLCHAHQMESQAWRCHNELARLHLKAGERAAAEQRIERARQLLATMAATIGDDVVRERFQAATSVLLPRPPELTPLQKSKQAAGGLTQRERSVALLVTQGMTNREIADDLFITVRTVKSHITNILTKLDLTSRSQLAVWVVESELARKTDPPIQ